VSSPREKAAGLIKLAADEQTTDKERVSAAVKAAAIIHKYKLLENPIDAFLDSNNETVKAVGNIVDTLTDEKLRSSFKTLKSVFGQRRRPR